MTFLNALKSVALLWPARMFHLIGGADFLCSQVFGHRTDHGLFNNTNQDHEWCYSAHGFLGFGHMCWGMLFLQLAKYRVGKSLPEVLFLISAVITGIATALPLFSILQLRETDGKFVYLSSVAYTSVYCVLLLNFAVRLFMSFFPSVFCQDDRHYIIGRLYALYWYSGYTLITYVFRYRLLPYPALNGLVHGVILAWHLKMVVFLGYQKPAYQSALEKKDEGGDKKED